jgi:hypothetical protein
VTNGEDLNGKTIFVHGEQGIGDRIFFQGISIGSVDRPIELIEATPVWDCWRQFKSSFR